MLPYQQLYKSIINLALGKVSAILCRKWMIKPIRMENSAGVEYGNAFKQYSMLVSCCPLPLGTKPIHYCCVYNIYHVYKCCLMLFKVLYKASPLS